MMSQKLNKRKKNKTKKLYGGVSPASSNQSVQLSNISSLASDDSDKSTLSTEDSKNTAASNPPSILDSIGSNLTSIASSIKDAITPSPDKSTLSTQDMNPLSARTIGDNTPPVCGKATEQQQEEEPEEQEEDLEEEEKKSPSVKKQEDVEQSLFVPSKKKSSITFGETSKPKIFIKPKKKSKSDLPKTELEKDYESMERDYNKSTFNQFLNKKELMNRAELLENKDYGFLYPSLDDPNFNIKIAEKKEFNDTSTIIKIENVQEEADKICNVVPELNPHQQFVRNFLSFSTPYNSLLLFHGLGTGKTCAAISVAEEQREYLKQLNLSQRIIVVASPNVQENFKLQLFDERKLEMKDGLWNLNGCLGNKFIKEINPTNLTGLTREQVSKQIKNLINNYYLFLGYIEFANFILKKSTFTGEPSQKKIQRSLNKFFNNRLIIIDEVHNIRTSDENQNKRVAQELFKLVGMVDSLRLLLLSATPMYNSYKEIIWLINLMNLNDRRSQIKVKDVFDSQGNFIEKDEREVGKELLERKATGYVSYVVGENPYSFPYKIWPLQFSPKNSLINKSGNIENYPSIQLNDREIAQALEHLDIYIEKIGKYQEIVYDYIIDQLKSSIKNKSDLPNFENMESFGYIVLQKPLEALNMTYPLDILEQYSDEENLTIDSKELVGKNGLSRIMSYSLSSAPPSRTNFQYKDLTFGRIFSPDEIGKYSSKIKKISESILNSEGIVLIYSQYIDGGVLPIALALEELGFTRYGNTPSLFAEPPVQKLDVKTYLPQSEVDPSEFKAAKYIMITGDKYLSPDSTNEIKAITTPDNKNGEKIKVVLISQAGSEGIDFKFIRQVHILEPWYNMNRIEQIIGRGVRNCSHKDLPFDERNVEIFLHGTMLSNPTEAVDLYVYRLAELKAVQIRNVTRLLKEISVDCLLNISQNNFNEDILQQEVKQKLSNRLTINYKVGNKPYSAICDYKESCQYSCHPSKKDLDINKTSYTESFIIMNNERIIERIRQLFKMKYFYYKDNLINLININKIYPIEQIDYALTQLVDERNEFIVDKLNRLGHLINVDDLYVFQPIELSDENISLYDRNRPIEYKRDYISLESNTIKGLFPKQEDKKKVLKIKKSIDEVSKDSSSIIKKEEEELRGEEDDLEAINLIKEINKIYTMAITPQLVLRGEKNYYKYYSLTIQELSEIIPLDYLQKFIIDHILESLSFEETLLLINYLFYTTDKEVEGYRLKSFYEQQILQNGKIKGLLLNDKGKQKLVIQKAKEFSLAESEDYVDLAEEIKKLIIPIDRYNNIVGFIGDFKQDYNIFKVKLLDKKRHKGARCDQSPKKEALELLGKILDEKDISSYQNINQIQICILQEIYLRYFQTINKNDKVWFLSPSIAILNNIEKISKVS